MAMTSVLDRVSFESAPDTRTLAPLGLLVTVVVLAASPFLAGKYLFLLDQVAGPTWQPFAARLFGYRTAAYGGSLPVYAFLAGVARLATPALAQKLLFVGVVSVTAATGYYTLPGNQAGRTYGAILLLINPFVYARLIAGQWAVVWGLAMIPLVILAYSTYLETGGPRSLLFAVGAITLLGFNAHLLYATGLLLGFITLFRYLDTRELGAVRNGAMVALVAVPVNAYWLGPTLFSGAAGLSRVGQASLFMYTPQSQFANPLFAAASMHGFWRGGIVYARDLVPLVQGLFAVVLFLAVYGFLSHTDGHHGYVVKALGATALVALPLSAGASGPTAPLFRWLFETVPFFEGMRDSGKFVALIVVAYAYLGALGTSKITESVPSVGGRQWSSVAVVVLILLVPLAYSFPMVTGYAGQIHTDDYPEGWYEAERLMAKSGDDGSVLVLPWHQYTSYSWIDGRSDPVSTPARRFFSRPVIQGDNVEIGTTYSTSDNALSGYVEFLFGLGPGNERLEVSNMGELLSHANVEYVVLTKDADWRYYHGILAEQGDLTLVKDGEHVEVYRNDRAVERGYAASGVVSVDDLSAFVSMSQRTDTTDSVVVLDGASSASVAELSGQSHPLAVEKRSPVQYLMSGTERRYSVFARSHRASGEGWRYAGEPPEYLHLGFQPAFASKSDRAELRYGPFYQVYLPSYGVSMLALLLVTGYGFSGTVGKRLISRRFERLRAGHRTRTHPDNDD